MFFSIYIKVEKMFGKYAPLKDSNKPAKPDTTVRDKWIGVLIVAVGIAVILISIFTLQGFVESIVIGVGVVCMFIGIVWFISAFFSRNHHAEE
jgi:hypothetical protein